jgi:hypothetical protein
MSDNETVKEYLDVKHKEEQKAGRRYTMTFILHNLLFSTRKLIIMKLARIVLGMG